MGLKVSATKQGVEIEAVPTLVRTAREPTGAWVVGDGDQVPAAPNEIELIGHDYLYLLVDAIVDAFTDIRMRLEFSHDDGATWFLDGGIQPGVLAAGIIPVDVGAVEYVFTTTGLYRLSLPLDDRRVRVSVKATGAGPAVTDSIGISAVRALRDGVVPQP